LYQPLTTDKWRGKTTQPSAALSAACATRTALELNLCLRSERLATDKLSYVTAFEES
jgi:hypothetical protein